MLKKILLAYCFLIFIITAGLAQENNVFNVRNYGAWGDGKHLDNGAINNAIDSAYAEGGGEVLVPAGTYLCGSIHLKSNISLCLGPGAVIMGAPPEMHAYDTAEVFPYTQYQDGGHTYFHNSLIWGENLHDVSIIGRGMINGGGLTSKDKEFDDSQTAGSIGTGDKSIALKLCKNVLIRDITIFHGGHFAILATGCDRLTIDNVTIDTNRDGIDVDCCQNTVVTNCRVNSPNDDAICPKSSYALNRPVVTENLMITNCVVSGYKEGTLLNGTRVPLNAGWSSGRIKFGTESNGGFKNCVVSDCVFRNCNGLALEEVDGGTMENIIVSNLVMEDVHHYPIYVTLGSRKRGPDATTGSSVVKNVFISNVMVSNADSMSGIQITGIPGDYIDNIQLKNIYVRYNGGGTRVAGMKAFPELGNRYPEPSLLGENPAYGIFVRHVKNIKLINITFVTKKRDDRSAIICSDVDGLAISDLKVPVVKGISEYKFDKVTNIIVHDSPLFNK
jgi:polygalacturonase